LAHGLTNILLTLNKNPAILEYIGTIAHAWLEQRTHNPLVLCSTHSGPTTYSARSIMDNTKSFYLLNVGSIPAGQTKKQL